MSRDADIQRPYKFLPETKRILGEHLIHQAPLEEDLHHNTDLMVLKLDAVRIACRVRTFPYLARYPNEFTIRSERPSGMQTELAKVEAGWGDYIFYGFANETDMLLAAWFIGDLNVLRGWIKEQRPLFGGNIPCEQNQNEDNSSSFMVFPLSKLPSEFVVARQLPPSLAIAS